MAGSTPVVPLPGRLITFCHGHNRIPTMVRLSKASRMTGVRRMDGRLSSINGSPGVRMTWVYAFSLTGAIGRDGTLVLCPLDGLLNPMHASGALKRGAPELFYGRLFGLMVLNRLACHFPRRAVLQQTGDERRVHGVTGALRHHVAFNAAARKCQISDQVQNLVADIFVVEPQWPVHRAFLAQNDGVLRT